MYMWEWREKKTKKDATRKNNFLNFYQIETEASYICIYRYVCCENIFPRKIKTYEINFWLEAQCKRERQSRTCS